MFFGTASHEYHGDLMQCEPGPSAGITMASSLLSLAFDQPLDPTIAMTGELTVTGKVLRIGGLREKTVAARRAGAKTIIFPADNMSDWLELPEVTLDLFLLTHDVSPLGSGTDARYSYRISEKASKATRQAGIRMSLTSFSLTWMSRQ